MSKRRKIILLLVSSTLLMAIAGLWATPGLLARLPPQVRHRLPHQLVLLVTTPLPPALPAPDFPLAQAKITIPALEFATSTPESTLLASSTAPRSSSDTATRSVFQSNASATPIRPQQLTETPNPPPTTTASPTSEPVPLVHQVEGLQVVPQKFNNCGPSNLSINLSFYGHHVDQLEIADILKPSYYDRNVGPQELVAYVNEYTPLKASLFQGGDLPLLKRLLSSGFPVVIEEGITPSEREGWMGHYLTLNGYDDIAEEFRALDTLLGPWDGSGRSISYETTIRQWAHFNYTFFVVYPLELEETVFEILGPEMLYPAMMWRRASLQAQAELEANVDNPFAWYNLGTSLTRWGQLASRPELLRDAAAAFDQARAIGLPPRMLWYQFEPYVAYLSVGRIDDVLALTDATLVSGGGRDIEETHYYRGNALMARGDREGAREAYERALQLNPGFGLAREALDRAG